jgi:hypothetical protein
MRKVGPKHFRTEGRDEKPPPKVRRGEQPWLAQGAVHKRGLIGITLDSNVRPVQTTDVRDGGWAPEAYLAAYRRHAPHAGRSRQVGAFLGAEEALKVLQHAMVSEEPLFGVVHPNPTRPPEADLIFGETAVAWGRGSGCWYPRAGSFKVRPHQPTQAVGKTLLPLVQRPPQRTDDEVRVLDVTIRDYLDAGFCRRWDRPSLPTTVVNLHVIQQGDSSRVIVDLRWTNASVKNVPMQELLSVRAVASAVRPGCRISKTDLKSGYHQYPVSPTGHALAAFIHRDVLYSFDAVTFGWRDAPGVFQGFTAPLAKTVVQPLGELIRFSGSYLDDFVQVWHEAIDEKECAARFDEVVTRIATAGAVMGKKKTLPPSKVQEVLGLQLDTVSMRITVPTRKIEAYRSAMTKLLERAAATTTLEVARVLGQLVSVEEAVAQLILATRPLFEDLKRALGGPDVTEIPEIRNGRVPEYVWNDTQMSLSAEGI